MSFSILDWLIIGGGVQGTYLSQVLVRQLGFDPDAVRVLDEAANPLAVWRRCTRACGMAFLRSPQVHNLGLRSDSLRRYARQTAWRDAFIAPYRRPALALFNAHAQYVVRRENLARLRLIGRAHRIYPVAGGYRIASGSGTILARRVLLALGPPPLHQPAWSKGLDHVFSPGFSLSAQGSGTTAVVGGGASGGQLALALADQGVTVDLVVRRGLRLADFDSPPCYLGPRCLASFARSTIKERRRIIAKARQGGTVPRDVYEAIAVHPGVRVWCGEVAGCTDAGLQFIDGRRLRVDRIALASGFAGRPGGELVKQAIAAMKLPVSADGWPLLATDLQWRPGLFVSGHLAMLELGPAAGNIIGARMMGRRLNLAHALGE
jgi:hypothetical protein